MKQFLFICFLVLVFARCKREAKRYFDVYGSDLKPSYIESLGYKRIWGVDVIKYERVQNDTTYVVTFEEIQGKLIPLTQDWIFKIKKIDTLKSYLRKRNIFPVDKILKDRKTPFINNKGNILYIGYFIDDFSYKIVYNIPRR